MGAGVSVCVWVGWYGCGCVGGVVGGCGCECSRTIL